MRGREEVMSLLQVRLFLVKERNSTRCVEHCIKLLPLVPTKRRYCFGIHAADMGLCLIAHRHG